MKHTPDMGTLTYRLHILDYTKSYMNNYWVHIQPHIWKTDLALFVHIQCSLDLSQAQHKDKLGSSSFDIRGDTFQSTDKS